MLFKVFIISILMSTSVCAQKMLKGIYYGEIDLTANNFELFYFKENGTFKHFHGMRRGNELGKGVYSIENNTLRLTYQDIPLKNYTIIKNSEKDDAFVSITVRDKKKNNPIPGATLSLKDKPEHFVTDANGIAYLPKDFLRDGSIISFHKEGFYTNELVYDGFQHIIYDLTNDMFYQSRDDAKTYTIVNNTASYLSLTFMIHIDLLGDVEQPAVLRYQKINTKKAKKLLGNHKMYMDFMFNRKIL